jgi:hypothetical protein
LPQHPSKQKNLFETVDWSGFEGKQKQANNNKIKIKIKK